MLRTKQLGGVLLVVHSLESTLESKLSFMEQTSASPLDP